MRLEIRVPAFILEAVFVQKRRNPLGWAELSISAKNTSSEFRVLLGKPV
jgi:hypothetical protein